MRCCCRDDDLALASVLKSPLFGLDEEQLFALAWNRKGTLRAALRAKAATISTFADANARLERYAALGAARDAVRASMRASSAPTAAARASMRGSAPEAADALDEFLELALDYERQRGADAAGLRRLAARAATRR